MIKNSITKKLEFHVKVETIQDEDGQKRSLKVPQGIKEKLSEEAKDILIKKVHDRYGELPILPDGIICSAIVTENKISINDVPSGATPL